MKKVLLIAIMALSINVFAQSKQPVLLTKENVKYAMENPGLKPSDIITGMIPGEILRHQQTNRFDPIQVYDSINDWMWDAFLSEWKIYSRSVDFVYDAFYNISSYKEQQWNGTAWINNSLYLNTYDVNNIQTSEIRKTWNGTIWVNSSQLIWTYDTQNNLTSETYMTWDGFTWANNSQYLITYDANSNPTIYLAQSWNGSAWVNIQQYLMTYDSHNNNTNFLYQIWNGTAWVNSYQDNFTFDVNNNMISWTYQTWTGADWANISRNIYTYDGSNILISYLVQQWNINTWVNISRYTNTYDANQNLVKTFIEFWNGSTYINSQQYTYTYDANKNKTSELHEAWDGINWVYSSLVLYSYDSNNLLKAYSSKSYINNGTIIDFGDSTCYYYRTAIGINDLLTQQESIKVYPNPGNGKFTISGNSQINSIEIYNLLGKRIYSEDNFNQQTSVDLSGHCSGIYVIKTHTGKINYYKKIIIQ